MSFLVSHYEELAGGGGLPSFFEIVAQDQMMPSLKMASKYILTVRW